MRRFLYLRRLPAALFIAAYLSLTAFYFVRHAMGDSVSHPLAYFWTWDMFPNYPTESLRRTAIAETASGRYVKLAPNSRQRFRWGTGGDVTRLDIDRRLLYFRRNALESIKSHNKLLPDDPVRHVYLAEQYRPAKFHLPEDLYQSCYTDSATGQLYWASSAEGEGVPNRKYWRILEEATVDAKGTVADWESSP